MLRIPMLQGPRLYFSFVQGNPDAVGAFFASDRALRKAEARGTPGSRQTQDSRPILFFHDLQTPESHRMAAKPWLLKRQEGDFKSTS